MGRHQSSIEDTRQRRIEGTGQKAIVEGRVRGLGSVAHDLLPRWCRGVSTRGSSTRADRMDFIVARNCGHCSKSPSIIPHNRPIRQAPLWIASQWFCPRSFCRTSPHYFNPKETDLYEISKRDEIKVGYYRSIDARRGTCSTICRDKVWR